MRQRKTALERIADIVIIVISLIWMLPLIFSILMSFRPERDPITNGNIFFGSTISLENYQQAWAVSPWLTHYLNSIIFVVGTLAVQVVTVTMAGYAFAR